MSLIDRLRRSYVDHGTNYVQEAADALERLAREKHEAQDCFDAAKDEIENLLAEEKMQLEQIVNQGLEIERLTAELTTSRYWREQEVKDLTAERDSLSVAAALWNHRYIDACQQHADRQTNLGHQIVALEAERDALKSALQLIKANTNTADWPDDINAAIQGEQL